MARYLAGRVAQLVVTLLAFMTLLFFLVQAQPGDFTTFYVANPQVTPESRQRLQSLFGVDKPVWQQYLSYLRNSLRGDLGTSFHHYPRDVTSVILERLPRTAVLFVTATVLSFYLGFAAGKIVAWRRGSLVEYVSTLGGVTLFTIFTPWFGLMLIWLFAFKAGWLPTGKFLNPEVWRLATVDANHVFNNMIITAAVVSALVLVSIVVASRLRTRRKHWLPVGVAALSLVALVVVWSASGSGDLAFDIVKHMVLPVATVTLITFAGTMLVTRNSMLEIMREDYVTAARAKGLPESEVRDKHVARNALLPVVTLFVFNLAFAIDGSVVVETIFSWPGMGLTLVTAVQQEDLPLAVGAFVFVGIFVLVAHLVADILYAFLDPRIRY